MIFYEYIDGSPVLSIYDMEKVSYYNDPQAHFLGGAKVQTSLEGKPQKFIDQLKQGLPSNIQQKIQKAADRGGYLHDRDRKAIDRHIKYVARSQNRGQNTDLNTAKGKRKWIGPEGQGYAHRGGYTGQKRKDPGIRSQIIQKSSDQPKPRSGQEGTSSVAGRSSRRSGQIADTPKRIQLRDIPVAQARDERAKMGVERKKRGVLRREALEASRAKEVARVKAIEEFHEAKRSGKKKRLEDPQAKKSKEGKLSRKEKKRLQREAAQPKLKASPPTPQASPPTPVSEPTPKKKLKISSGEGTPKRKPPRTFSLGGEVKPPVYRPDTPRQIPEAAYRDGWPSQEEAAPKKKLKASGGDGAPKRRPLVVSQAKPQFTSGELREMRKPSRPFMNPSVDLSDLASGTQRKKKLKATSSGTKPSSEATNLKGKSKGNYPTTRERIDARRRKPWTALSSGDYPTTRERITRKKKLKSPTPNPVNAPTPNPVNAPTPNPVNAPTPSPRRAPAPRRQSQIATQVMGPRPASRGQSQIATQVMGPRPASRGQSQIATQVSSGPKKKLRATSGAPEVKSQPKKLRTSSSMPRVKSQPVPWHKRGVGAALNTRAGKIGMGVTGATALAHTFGLIGNSNRVRNARRAQQIAEAQQNNPSSRSM
jgi:hypothetical protein